MHSILVREVICTRIHRIDVLVIVFYRYSDLIQRADTGRFGAVTAFSIHINQRILLHGIYYGTMQIKRGIYCINASNKNSEHLSTLVTLNCSNIDVFQFLNHETYNFLIKLSICHIPIHRAVSWDIKVKKECVEASCQNKNK